MLHPPTGDLWTTLDLSSLRVALALALGKVVNSRPDVIKCETQLIGPSEICRLSLFLREPDGHSTHWQVDMQLLSVTAVKSTKLPTMDLTKF